MNDAPHGKAAPLEPAAYLYDAFISYRHDDIDRRCAKWLHRALETYRVPAKLVRQKGVPERLGRVFRDEDELPASADLSQEIEKALAQSRFLIVVCSPRTPQSRWVNEEIQRFRELGRGDQILALLVEGEPSDAFPAALREIRPAVVEDAAASGDIQEVEPLAADMRSTRGESRRRSRRMAKLRLLACLLDCRFDDLRQREQERLTQRWTIVSAATALLVLVMAGLAAFALAQKQEADNQRSAAVAAQGVAETQQRKAEAKTEESRQRLVKLYSDNGSRAMADDDYATAMLWYSGALAEEKADSPGVRLHRLRIRSILRKHPRLVHAWWHDAPVVSAQFVGDVQALTASRDGQVRLWNVETGQSIAGGQFGEHLQCAALSADGERLVTGDAENVARVWNLKSGEPISAPMKHDNPIYRVLFTNGGQHVMTASRRYSAELLGQALLWDASSGEALPQPRASDELGSPSWYSLDEKRAVVTSLLGSSVFWADGMGLSMPLSPGDGFGAVDFTPDGKRFMLASLEGGIEVFDAANIRAAASFNLTGGGSQTSVEGVARVGKLERRDREAVRSVAFSPDGKRAAACCLDGTAVVWDPAQYASRPLLPPLMHAAAVNVAAFSPNGRYLLTASDDHGARLWAIDEEEPTDAVLHVAQSDSQIAHAFLKEDDRNLLLKYRDGRFARWNFTAQQRPLEPLEINVGEGASDRTADGRRLLVNDGTKVRLLDAHTLKWLGQSVDVEGSAYSSCNSGDYLFCRQETAGQIVDARSGDVVSELKLPWSPDRTILTNDAGRLAIARTLEIPKPKVSNDQLVLFGGRPATYHRIEVQLFDGDGQPLTPVLEQSHLLRRLLIDPTGTLLAVSTGEVIDRRNYARGEVRVWNLQTGQAELEPIRRMADVLGIAFSPDGKALVVMCPVRFAGDPNGGTRIYSADTGQPLTPPLPINAKAVRFSHDGRLLATIHRDSLQLWDAHTGAPVSSLLEHPVVQDAFFTQDDSRLVSYSPDQAIAWDLQPDPRPPASLVALAQVLACRQVDPARGVTALTPAELKRAFALATER